MILLSSIGSGWLVFCYCNVEIVICRRKISKVSTGLGGNENGDGDGDVKRRFLYCSMVRLYSSLEIGLGSSYLW